MARKNAKLLAAMLLAAILVSFATAFSSFAAQDYNLTVIGATVSVTAGDQNLGEAGTHATVADGTSVTLTASGDDFLFYADKNGNVLSEEATYTFTMYGYRWIEAVYKAAGKTTVLYQNTNETKAILGSAVYSSAEAFTAHLAETAQNFGYEFDGWNKTVDDVKAAITNGDAVVIVNPNYIPVGTKVTVTAVGGTVDGAESGRFTVRTTVGLEAAAPEEGKEFSHWATSSGFPISTESYIRIQVTGEETYTAVFVDAGTAVPPVAATEAKIVGLDGATSTNFDVYAIRYAPKDIAVLSYGVIYAKSNGFSESDLVLSAVNGDTIKLTAGSSEAAAGTVIYHVNDTKDLIVRPYMILQNGETVYGAAVSAHHYASELTVVPATCTTAGEQYYACTDPECTVKKDYKLLTIEDHRNPDLNGNIQYHVEIRPLTCGDAGNHEYWYCADCDMYMMLEPGTTNKIFVTPNSVEWKLEHDLSVCTYDNNATCLTAGTMSGTCGNCNSPITVPDPAHPKLEHQWSDTYSKVSDATCVKEGLEVYYCIGVSDNGSPVECTAYDEENTHVLEIDPTAHNYTEYIPNEDADCTKSGTMTRTCQNEGCTNPTDTVDNPADPQKAHTPAADYTITSKPGAENGEAVKYCTVCEQPIEETKITLDKLAPVATAPLSGVIDGTKITVTTDATTGAGFYRVVLGGAPANGSTYYSIYNNAYGADSASYNRPKTDSSASEYPVYVYLDAGENTLTASFTATSASFEQVTGEKLAVTKNLGDKWGGEATKDYTFKVSANGFYFLNVMYGTNGAGFKVSLKKGDGEAKLLVENPTYFKTGDSLDGSSNSRILSVFGYVFLEGDVEYTLKVECAGNWNRVGMLFVTRNTCIHEYEKTVIEPTCSSGGYTVDICKGCGDEKEKRDPVGEGGHRYGDWVVTDPKTDATGSATRSCVGGCGLSDTVELAKLPTLNTVLTSTDFKEDSGTSFKVTAPVAGIYKATYATANSSYVSLTSDASDYVSRNQIEEIATYFNFIYLKEGDNVVTYGVSGDATLKPTSLTLVGYAGDVYVSSMTKTQAQDATASFEFDEATLTVGAGGGFYSIAALYGLGNGPTSATLTVTLTGTTGDPIVVTYDALTAFNAAAGTTKGSTKTAKYVVLNTITDGNTNSTGIIYLPEGTYTLTASMTLAGSNPYLNIGTLVVSQLAETDSTEPNPEPGDHTCSFGDWSITTAPTKSTSGTAERTCTESTCDQKEVVTLSRSVATTGVVSDIVIGTDGTVTLNASSAGLYRVVMEGAPNDGSTYYGIYNTALGVTSASNNRLASGVTAEARPVYVYLSQGANTLKCATGTANTPDALQPTSITFTQVTAEEYAAYTRDSSSYAGRKLTSSNGAQAYETFKVSEDGFYFISGMAGGLLMDVTIDNNVVGTLSTTSGYWSSADAVNGSGATKILVEYGCVYLKKDVDYTISMEKTSGGDYCVGAVYVTKAIVTPAE